MSNVIVRVVLVVAAVGAFLWFRGGAGGGAVTPQFFDKSVTMEAALSRGKAEGKPVLAFFTADWCGPCQAWKRGALAETSVGEAAKARTVPVYVDLTDRNSAAAQKAAQRFGVQSIPTMILIDPSKDDAQLSRMSGGSASEVVAWIGMHAGK